MKNNACDISVVTICYNKSEGFERTAKSLLTARERTSALSVEWLVIDGGSDSETTEVQKKYAEHMAYYQSEKDGGIYPAMNIGMNKARGKYIVFMNAGDEFTNNALQIVEQAIDLYPETQFIYGEQICRQDIDEFGYSYTGSPTEGQLRMNDYNLVCPHQSTYYDLSLIRKFGMQYDESYKIIADIKFTNEFKKVMDRYSYVPLPLAIFEEGGISSTTCGLREREDAKYEREADKFPDNHDVFVRDVERHYPKSGILNFLKKKL